MNAWTLLPALLAITVTIDALVTWVLTFIAGIMSAYLVIPFAIEFAESLAKGGTVDWVGLGGRIITLIVASALILNMAAVVTFFKTLVIVTAT